MSLRAGLGSAALAVGVFLAVAHVAVAGAMDEYREGVGLAKAGRLAEALAVWRPLLGPARRSELLPAQQVTVAQACGKVYRKLGDEKQAGRYESFARAAAGKASGGSAPSLKESFEAFDQALFTDRLTPGSQKDAFAALVPAFRKAAAGTESPARAQYALGTCLLRLGTDDAEAERLLLESARDDGMMADAALELAGVAQRRGDADGRIGWLQRAVAGGRGAGAVLVDLACSMAGRMAAGDADEVVALTDCVVNQDPAMGRTILASVKDQDLRDRVEPLVTEAERAAEKARKDEEAAAALRRAAAEADEPPPTPTKDQAEASAQEKRLADLMARYGSRIPGGVGGLKGIIDRYTGGTK